MGCLISDPLSPFLSVVAKLENVVGDFWVSFAASSLLDGATILVRVGSVIAKDGTELVE